MCIFSPRRINHLYSGFIWEHQVKKVKRREQPQFRKPKYKSSMVRTLQDKQNEESLKKKIAARMFMAGFEPITIAEMQRLSLAKLRDWINKDEDFRMAVKDLQGEFLGALEKKYQFLLYKAYEKLDVLLDSVHPTDVKWGVDKTLQIHGKYVERVEDMTPPERRPVALSPEQTMSFLDKGIRFLELTRKREEPVKAIEMSSQTFPTQPERFGARFETILEA